MWFALKSTRVIANHKNIQSAMFQQVTIPLKSHWWFNKRAIWLFCCCFKLSYRLLEEYLWRKPIMLKCHTANSFLSNLFIKTDGNMLDCHKRMDRSLITIPRHLLGNVIVQELLIQIPCSITWHSSVLKLMT